MNHPHMKELVIILHNDTEIRSAAEIAAEEEYAELGRLIDRAKLGYNEALCELIEKIAKGVLFRTTLIIGDETSAQDIAQKILFRVCKNIRTLRSVKVFNLWLGTIIISETNRFLRRNKKIGVVLKIENYMETFYEESDEYAPQGHIENDAQKNAIVDIISNLPIMQKEAVLLHYYSEFSVTEVAKAMNISKQSVSVYLKVAREKIKSELEKQPHSSYLRAAGVEPVSALISGAFGS